MERILLATATTTETQAVLPVFEAAIGRPKKGSGSIQNLLQAGRLGSIELTLVQSEAGASTPGGSLSTLGEAIRVVEPSAVIMIGIAFGMKPGRSRYVTSCLAIYLRL